MQFFEHQDQARGRTTLLLILFGLSVLGLGLLSAAAMHFALSWGRPEGEPLGPFHLQAVLCAAIATFGLILLGSAYKITTLRSGGRSVAEALGGTLAASNAPYDAAAQRVINIVEEMAIAAGMPVPPVYILRNEPGINAFAAGWSLNDAVVAVTQGALVHLNRDQLQGVIAHEFSHILNRDCALNMRILGVLHGIVVLSSIGRFIMHFSSSSRHTSTKREGGTVQIFMIGALIWLFGSLGVFVARLIQAAVSQQREFLADASAVQFTRNPWGIASALAKIASESSALSAPSAQDSSHMLISSPETSALSGVLASHPPLFERIKRIIPSWDGDFATLAPAPASGLAGSAPAAAAASAAVPASGQAPHEDGSRLILERVVSGFSAVSHGSEAAHPLSNAVQVVHGIDPTLRAAASEPFMARALLVLWAMDPSAHHRATQEQRVAQDPALYAEVRSLRPGFFALEFSAHLSLFDLTLPTLALLSAPQKRDFARLLAELQQQLAPDSYRPYCLTTLALRHLGKSAVSSERKPRLLIKPAIETAIGVLARQGQSSEEEARAAFASGCQSFAQRSGSLHYPDEQQLSVQTFDAALCTLERLPIHTKQLLLNAAETVAAHNGVVSPSEQELLRVMATCLNVPCPISARPISALSAQG